MNIGRLRHRVTIQKPTLTQNAFDEWVVSWSTLATVWASIEPNVGKRYFEAKQANSEVEGTTKIRYRSDVEPDMRVTYGSQILQILSIVHPGQRGKELHLQYKEVLD